MQKGAVQWLDFPAKAVVALAVSAYGLVCATEGGTVVVYSPAGVRSVPASDDHVKVDN